jgi:cytochrome b involved in lipid metabolism
LNSRGGEEVLLDVGGQDATEAFEDVGHSDEAREILEGLAVGKLKRQVRLLECFPNLKQILICLLLGGRPKTKDCSKHSNCHFDK